MDWAEKYRPARLADIVGNATAVRQVADWAKTWTNKSRPLLLYGRPGTGKTSTALALAHDMGWELIELNASDQRTAAVIERVAGAGSTSGSLTGATRRLVVLDEADNLQGTADRGGAKAIVECIGRARQPVILIANDLYGIQPEIRNRCEPVQFKAVQARSIVPRLRYICSAEKVRCSDTALRIISESAEGDIRSAVNMLHASAAGREALDDTGVHTSQKDERISIFSLISALFQKIPDRELMRLSREVEDTPETIEQWIEGSIHLIAEPGGIGKAYRTLARADEYIGWTYRRQYHILWRYATAIMLIGVADAAGGRGIHARIMPPERWQKMSAAKKQRSVRTSAYNKIAGMMLIPQSTLREQYIGLVSLLIEHDPGMFAASLSFDADQLNLFLSDRARSAAIIRAVAQTAQKMTETERRGELPQTKGEGKSRTKKESRKPETIPEEPAIPDQPVPPEEPEPKEPRKKTQSTLDGF